MNIDQKQKIRSMIFFKRFNYESKITKFDHIFDTKDFIQCVVYDQIVDEKLFENLKIKFLILQTKKICQFFYLFKNRQ